MAIEGGMHVVRYLVIIFNFIFVLVGLALMIVGGLVASMFKQYIDVMGVEYSGAPIVIGVAGAIVFLVAFFGCCGAVKKSPFMVTVFAFLLVVVLLFQIGAGIAAFVMKGKVENAVAKAMKDSLINFNVTNDDNIYNKFINSVQQEFKCCGGKDYEDWIAVFNKTEAPVSCCKKSDPCKNKPTWSKSNPPPKNMYTKGCIKGFEDFLRTNIGIVAGVAVGVCFIQILGIIFACCLTRSLSSYEYV